MNPDPDERVSKRSLDQRVTDAVAGCECVGYTIRTDYGTGTEHDVDRGNCPIHGAGITRCACGCGPIFCSVRCYALWVTR